MGAIQSSLNQIGGAIAGAAVSIKHLEDKELEKTKLAGDLTASMQNEKIENTQKLLENEAQSKADSVQLEMKEAEYDKAIEDLHKFEAEKHSRHTDGEKKGQFMSKADKKEKIKAKRHDLRKMQEAMGQLKNEITGLGAQKEMITANMKAHSVRNEIYKKQLGKYGYAEPKEVEQSAYVTVGGKK